MKNLRQMENDTPTSQIGIKNNSGITGSLQYWRPWWTDALNSA